VALKIGTGLRLLIGALLLIFALWISTVALIVIAGNYPNLRKADAILVLGAAQWNGRPSPVLRARLDHALLLHRKGYAPYLVFTGGVGPRDTLSEGEVARRYAMKNGIDSLIILVEREGVTSAASVTAAATLMHERGLTSALVVSDSYHMLRVELLARRSGLIAYRAPAPNSPIDRVPSHYWRYVLRESVLFPATALMGERAND
jgi:uncharacterized SAM-binding protein YcdF (DUF218 family)